jgi:hypothetical protein
MAAKPTDLAIWNSGGLNRTTPALLKRGLGFIRGEKPASSYFNWFFNTMHTWVAYLSDGALEGDHSIDGDLSVTGATTLTGAVGVTGDTTLTGNLDVTGTITGTGVLKHGDMVRTFSAVNGKGSNWTLDSLALVMEAGVGGGALYVPITVHEGEQLKSLKVGRLGNATDNFVFTFFTLDAAGSFSVLATSTLVTPAATWADVTLDLLNTTVGTGVCCALIITAGGGDQAVSSIRLTYARPS